MKRSSSNKHIMLVFTSNLPSSFPLEMTNMRWLKKIQGDTGGLVQISCLDTSGPIDTYTGGIAGFKSWDELREYVDIVEGTASLFYIDLPVLKNMKWFVTGTDLCGSLQIYNQLLNEFPEMQAEYTKINVKRLCGWAGYGETIQTRDKPVRTLEDFKGLKISMQGNSYEIFDKLGAIELAVTPGEEYLSIARGQANATSTLPEFLNTMLGGDVIRYNTFLHIPFVPQDFIGMKWEKWNSLPKDVQKVFENSEKWFYDKINKMQLKATQDAIDWARARGVEFIELPKKDQDKFTGLMEEIALKKAAELEALGIPGTKIYKRTRQLIDEYERSKYPVN